MYKNIIIILIIVLSITACKEPLSDSDENITSDGLLEIHLQSWFDSTWVRIDVDESIVTEKKVSTGEILAYAAIIPVKVKRGEHQLHVEINNNVESDTSFIVEDTLYAGINYGNENISFKFQRNPFSYK